MSSPHIKNALISVSNKEGLVAFAKGLKSAGINIFSTGGTREHLEREGIEIQDISSYTGFPEMMDGRLKTLHPKVFGGILCRHDRPDDMSSLAEHEITPFELIVVNLYPFEETIARNGVTEAEAIEQIDIGGPSLVRAAAKNHAFTTISTNPGQYSEILSEIKSNGSTSLNLRRKLAAEAFAKTAGYDCAIADYFSKNEEEEDLPQIRRITLHRKAVLRYGENPHQKAAVYSDGKPSGANLLSSKQLNGKELSYNNLLDLDSALSIVRSIEDPAAVVIKHNNPCGAAYSDTLSLAAEKALAGDPVSAFGSVLSFNRPVDAETAEILVRPNQFIEAIVAPDFHPDALETLTTRPKWKANVRLIAVGELDSQPNQWQTRWIEGGMLIQNADSQPDPTDQWNIPTKSRPNNAMIDELNFAWAIVRHVKSNAIVLCQNQALCGAGAGQMSRVDSVEIAINKAGPRGKGSVLASDAFFPFADSIHRAAEAGISAIIQPGGSRRDSEVIAACDEHGIPMVFTGYRHFKH